jgi:hypothetical protein
VCVTETCSFAVIDFPGRLHVPFRFYDKKHSEKAEHSVAERPGRKGIVETKTNVLGPQRSKFGRCKMRLRSYGRVPQIVKTRDSPTSHNTWS